MNSLQVLHNSEHKHFKINTLTACAYLAYEMVGEDAIEIYRTFVPEALKYQGVAARLADAALSYARKHQLKVIPSCAYIADYLAKEQMMIV